MLSFIIFIQFNGINYTNFLQVEFALEVSVRALKFFKEFFGVAYTLPKDWNIQYFYLKGFV